MQYVLFFVSYSLALIISGLMSLFVNGFGLALLFGKYPVYVSLLGVLVLLVPLLLLTLVIRLSYRWAKKHQLKIGQYMWMVLVSYGVWVHYSLVKLSTVLCK